MRYSYLIASAVSLGITGLAQARPTDYQLDPVHTQITFFVDHLGFSRSSGRFHIQNGYFHFDANDWSTAKVDASIAIASLDMGDVAWEKKLKSDEFFNLDQYPTARFISHSVEKIGANQGIIHGALSLHGITQNIDLPFTLNKLGIHSYSFKYTAGFSATVSIKRSDYNIKALLPGVGDVIELRLEVEGQRDRSAAKNANDNHTESDDKES